jgi:hypothetical protein
MNLPGKNFARLDVAADFITCTKSCKASIGIRSANVANAEYFGADTSRSTNDDNTTRAHASLALKRLSSVNSTRDENLI